MSHYLQLCTSLCTIDTFNLRTKKKLATQWSKNQQTTLTSPLHNILANLQISPFSKLNLLKFTFFQRYSKYLHNDSKEITSIKEHITIFNNTILQQKHFVQILLNKEASWYCVTIRIFFQQTGKKQY